MPSLIDLKGRRIGKLFVIGNKITIKGRPHWPCKCDCGKECLKPSERLLSGDCNSCGCSMGPPIKYKLGDRIGRLVILERIKKDRGDNFRCICDCGKIKIINVANLSTTRSCGCLIIETIRKPKKFNQFLFEGDIVKIITKQGLQVILDREDFPKIEKHYWFLHEGYPVTQLLGKRHSLVYMVIEKKEGLVVDHIDRNPLNNRKGNLRYASKSQNIWNSFSHQKKTKGISFHKPSGKWWARIAAKNIKYSLGLFETKEGAMNAYDQAAKRLHGIFALTNSSNAHIDNNPLQNVEQQGNPFCP
jgi:hypothetical protein